VNRNIFSTVLLVLCLAVMSSAALGQQRQPRRSGGLDNMSLPSTDVAIASSSWQEFAPEGAGFSVMMPGLPDEMSKDMGPNATNLREYRVKNNGTEYIVGVFLNFPVEMIHDPKFMATYFDVLPRAMIGSAEYAGKNYKLIAQRAITLNDFPGRQFKFDAADYTCTMRVFLAEHSIYIISIESPKASASIESAEKFFSSFALKGN
jgi:hypothetical protein